MLIPPGCCSNLVFVKGKFTIKKNKVCQVNQQSPFAVQQWKCWQPSLEYFKASSEASEGEVGGLLSSESTKIILFLYIKPYKCPFKVSASVMLLKAVGFYDSSHQLWSLGQLAVSVTGRSCSGSASLLSGSTRQLQTREYNHWTLSNQDQTVLTCWKGAPLIVSLN